MSDRRPVAAGPSDRRALAIAAALGHPPARAELEGRAPPVVTATTESLRGWPRVVLARVSLAAAEHVLPLHDEVWPDRPQPRAALERLGRWLEEHPLEPFPHLPGPGPTGGDPGEQMAVAVEQAVRSACRSAAALQSRDLRDPDPPRATVMALRHAARAVDLWRWIGAGRGQEWELAQDYVARAQAAARHADRSRARVDEADRRWDGSEIERSRLVVSAMRDAVQATRLEERAEGIRGGMPDPGQAWSEVLEAVRVEVIPWLLTLRTLPADELQVGLVVEDDGVVVRELEYDHTGRLVAVRTRGGGGGRSTRRG